MTAHTHCEVFGSLEKVEQFTTLAENIIPGTLVFESPAPFWGYYNEFDSPQTDLSPQYIYIATLKTYAVFDVVRAFNKVKEKFDFDLDAAKAFVRFNDRFYNAIRLRHIDGYTNIVKIQQAFEENGIGMLMANSSWNNVTTNVSLKKVFCLKELTDTIYTDACESNHFYITIPNRLSFEEFADVTRKVKNNWLGTRFDAALGYFLRENAVTEIIRIYTENHKLEDLEAIHKLYMQKIP